MINVHEAMKAAEEKTVKLLKQAGLKQGIGMTEQEIRQETTPMFWRMQIKGKAASEKHTYVVYSVNSVECVKWMDGSPHIYEAVVHVSFFTQSNKLIDTIKDVDQKFTKNDIPFNLVSSDFDPATQLHFYTFGAMMHVVDDGEVNV